MIPNKELMTMPDPQVILPCLLMLCTLSGSGGEDSHMPAENELPNDLSKFNVSAEKRLLQDLMPRYQKMGQQARPVYNSSHPVTVYFGLGLIKMELHEKENMLTMSAWTRLRWKDEYLTWNPENYNGLVSVKLEASLIWTPDIMLYNTANTEESERRVRAVVTYDGTVSWFPHRMFHSSCAIDVRNFPFDNQTCFLWFGSWTHPLDELDAQLAFDEGMDLSTFKSVYKDSSAWEIFENSAERLVQPPEGPMQFTILSFRVQLRRKLMFSTYILTLPAIFLAFLTLLEFWLPPDHADKSALGLTIFGSLLLLLLILVEAAPPTASAVPLLGIYYCFTTVIVILSIFLSALVVKIGRSGEEGNRPPRIIKILILGGLARIVCMTHLNNSCSGGRNKDRRRNANVVDNTERELLPVELTDRRDCWREDDPKLNGASGSLSNIEHLLRAILNIYRVEHRMSTDNEKKRTQQKAVDMEWRRVAMVLDRLFFYLYLATIIGSLILLFPRRAY